MMNKKLTKVIVIVCAVLLVVGLLATTLGSAISGM